MFRVYREGSEGNYKYYINYGGKHYVNFKGTTGGVEILGEIGEYFVEIDGKVVPLDVTNVW